MHLRTGFFLAMFSVSETPEDALQFLRVLSFQISSPWFLSPLYLNSLPGFCSFLHRLYCARSLPTNIFYKCLSGGNERNKVGVRDFRNSCANQNRVHFVVFPRLYVWRELEAATVWCETSRHMDCGNLYPRKYPTGYLYIIHMGDVLQGYSQAVGGGAGGAWAPDQKPSPPWAPQMKWHFVQGSMESCYFWVTVSPLSPFLPLSLKSLATPLMCCPNRSSFYKNPKSGPTSIKKKILDMGQFSLEHHQTHLKNNNFGRKLGLFLKKHAKNGYLFCPSIFLLRKIQMVKGVLKSNLTQDPYCAIYIYHYSSHESRKARRLKEARQIKIHHDMAFFRFCQLSFTALPEKAGSIEKLPALIAPNDICEALWQKQGELGRGQKTSFFGL